jgi:hypothetical protein
MTRPAVEALRLLKRRGFHELVILSRDCRAVQMLVYTRTDDEGTEILVVHMPDDDAHAYRIRATANDPFLSGAPPVDRGIPTGDVVTVVYALLSEGQPIDEGA